MPSDVERMAGERLASAGVRLTSGRREVLRVLADSERPLTTGEIAERGASGNLALSSVYRNLAVLEVAGVVRRVAAVDEFGRYELAEEMTGHHHHLLCSVCGLVEDVTLPLGVERAVDRALAEAASAVGFEGTHHRLDLVGRCAACR